MEIAGAPSSEDHINASIAGAEAEDPAGSTEQSTRELTEEQINASIASAEAEDPAGSTGKSTRELTEELAERVAVLECESSAEGGGTCRVYLVGTAHVSQESCREVREVIRCLKPQVVFLELCSNRIGVLTPQKQEKGSTVYEIISMWKKKKMNIFGILYSLFLTKVSDKLEVLPGSEFRVAFDEAMSYGAKVILGDRPIHITLRRTWGKMPLWNRAKFIYYILFQTLFLPSSKDLNEMLKKMDDADMITILIQEMGQKFPTLMQTLVHERDMYLSSMLLKVAREHSSVVAVVGRGHIPGIKKHWEQPIEMSHLLEIPARSGFSGTKILASVVAVTGVAIASCIYLLNK